MLKIFKTNVNFLCILFTFLYLININCFAYSKDSIYNLNAKLIDKNGIFSTLGDLKGKIQIFSMVYTNCKTICPIIISNMKSIEKMIPKEDLKHVNFLLISLDPDRDSVDSLLKFFREKKLNDAHWEIFKTSKKETLKLALTCGIKYKKEKNNEYTHSNLIIVLDKEGVIKMHHQGLDKNFDKVIKIISSLK